MPGDTTFTSDLDNYLEDTRRRVEQATNSIQRQDDDTHSPVACQNRYLYNSERDLWYDTFTNAYFKYDKERQTYLPVSMYHDGDTSNRPGSDRVHDITTGNTDGNNDVVDPDVDDSNEPQSDACCRLVVTDSIVIPVGQVVIMDANGMSIGRDKHEWDTRRLRLRDMQVSKYHCQFFYDQTQAAFAVIDMGSQNGTYLNGERLCPAKQSSPPFVLKHGDQLELGVTTLQVHFHEHGWPCQQCQTTSNSRTNGVATATAYVSPVPAAAPSDDEDIKKESIAKSATVTKKQFRQQLLQRYQSDVGGDDPSSSHENALLKQQGHYIDRARLRRERQASTSYPRKYNEDDIVTTPTVINLHTPVQGKGYDILRKMGWQQGQGMGASQQGIIEPIMPSNRTATTVTSAAMASSSSSPSSSTMLSSRAGIGAPVSKKDQQYQHMRHRYHQQQHP